MRHFLAIAILALLFSGCADKNPQANILPKAHHVIFTTGLDIDSNPIDNVEEITLDEQKIYIYVKWKLPLIKRVQKTKIFDGANNLIYSTEFSFTPETVNWDTWTWHKINKIMDKEGTWKFQIFSDDKLVIEKTIVVKKTKESDANL